MPKLSNGFIASFLKDLMDGQNSLYLYLNAYRLNVIYDNRGIIVNIVQTNKKLLLPMIVNVHNPINVSVLAIEAIRLFVAGFCKARKKEPIIFAANVRLMLIHIKVATSLKFGTNDLSTLSIA